MSNDAYDTDEDAAKDLYGASPSDQRFRTLKSRTYERLLQSVLFLEVKQPEHSEYLVYYYKCMRNLIGAQSLLRFAARKTGYTIALKTLTVAKKYQFIDICLPLATLLRESAAIYKWRTVFLHHHADVLKFQGALKCENESDFLLDHIEIELTITSRKRAYIIDLYQDAVAKIDAMLKEHGTHKLQLNSYRVAAYYNLYIEDFESVIRACDGAMEYLDQHPHMSSPARYGEFNLQKLSTAVFVRRYEDAYQMADKCIGSFAEAGNNWYFATDMAFVAAINLRDFQKAENYYMAATNHRKYNALNVSFKERWTLYAAYLHLAERLELYTSKQSRSKPFRLSTYLNSLPAESKSKKVYNVFIIISHVFFLMLDGDFDLAEKRIEYLRVYSSRYLKEKQLNRVRIFLRLIQSFPKHSFIPEEIRKNSKALFHELEATSRDPMPSDTNELIPFELMYEALLKTMEKNS